MTASISAAIRGTNDHLAIGIGGTRQAVLSAAALRCLGGELQAQLWPTHAREIEAAKEHGIDDVKRVFTTEDLAPGEVIVAATGVSNGDLLRGVRFLADSARTHSLVMCTRCNWVRFIDGIHFFAAASGARKSALLCCRQLDGIGSHWRGVPAVKAVDCYTVVIDRERSSTHSRRRGPGARHGHRRARPPLRRRDRRRRR